MTVGKEGAKVQKEGSPGEVSGKAIGPHDRVSQAEQAEGECSKERELCGVPTPSHSAGPQSDRAEEGRPWL